MRPLAPVAFAALLAGCGQPLLSTQLEFPGIRIALPAQQFPALSSYGLDLACADTAHCVEQPFTYDLGAEIPMLGEDGVTLDLRLTEVALQLARTGASGNLGGVVSARVSVQDPATGAWTELASYERAGPGAIPTELAVARSLDFSIERHLRDGTLPVRLEIVFDPSNPPPAFSATLEATFAAELTIEYRTYL